MTSASAISAQLARAGLRPVASRTKEGLYVSGGVRSVTDAVNVSCNIDGPREAARVSSEAEETLRALGYDVHRSDDRHFTVRGKRP